MKILLVNSVCGVGSTGKICVDLANTAKSFGHECVIAYGRGDSRGWSNVYKITNGIGNKLHYIKSRVFDKHGLGNVPETKRFIKFIKSYDPDIIHLHNIHGYFLNYKILFNYLKTTRAKIVWTMHDMWPITGHCVYAFDCNKWEKQCKKCEYLNDYPKALFDNSFKNYKFKQESFTRPDRMEIITPSEWLTNLFKRSSLNKYKINTINNGIDLKVFKFQNSDWKTRQGLRQFRLVLGVASVWDRRKGLNDIITLSNMLEDDVRIVLVGLTKKQISKLPPNIIGIERTQNQQELSEIYSSAELFINLTYADNFPTVNIESLASGTPVLTYKTGGSPESITNKTGFVVEQGDVEKVAEIVNAFKKTEQTIQDCVEQSKKYNKNDKFKDYIRLYEGN